MSGFGRGGGKGGHGGGGGRGSGGGGMAALRRGMPPKKNQQPKSTGAGARMDSGSSAAASSAQEESFQLVCAPQGSSQFAMMIRLTPGLLDELRRAEAEGATSSIKFASLPSGHVLKVGHEEYKFSSAPEPGELCDVFEEQKPGDDGQGVLAAVGSVWRKISVQRTLSASEKDRVKKRSIEAEQQIKSRKAILVDSSLMKAETGSAGDAAGRRPPIKGKKEPPPKKRKVAPTVVPAAKSKPPPAHSASVPPPKERNGPVLPPEPAATAAAAAARSPPLGAAAAAPPAAAAAAAQPQLLLPASEKRALVEEITVGGSSSPARSVSVSVPKEREKEKEKEREKEKSSAATTPEVNATKPTFSGGVVNMTELRNTIIALLTETPRGIKAIEKSLSEVMAQPDRKSIEKILKSIALYKAPGKYELKPGIQPETYTGPSPGSGSLPDAASAGTPESPAGAAESKPEQSEFAKLPTSGVEVERIDIGEDEETPSAAEQKSNADEEEGEFQVGGTPEDDAANHAQAAPPAEPPNPSKPSAASSGSSSTSGSGTDSDSESGSSSGSGSSGSSGTESSGSSSDEEENVDIVSDDDNNKPKPRSEKKSEKKSHKEKRPGSERRTPAHHRDKDSELDIDIDGGGDGSGDSARLDSIVERITETIPIEVDEVGSPEVKPVANDPVPVPVAPPAPLPASVPSPPPRPPEDEPRQRERTPEPEPVVSKAPEPRPRERDRDRDRERASSLRQHPEIRKVEAPVEPGREIAIEAPEARVRDPETLPVPVPVPVPDAHHHHRFNSSNSVPEIQPRHPVPPPSRIDGHSKAAARKSKDQPRQKIENRTREEPEKKQTEAIVQGESSLQNEFFAQYERASTDPTPRGPITSYEQYMEYCREYWEKYPVYVQLNSHLERDRENFEKCKREIDIAKSANDKNRLEALYHKVSRDYLHCRKRFKRMSKTFLLLHGELLMLKERCNEYARQTV